MMFLGLHLSDNNEEIMFNINMINCIYQTKGTTNIYVGEVIYQVKESYEEIIKAINNYYDLPKAYGGKCR
jgi:hypothetical protein